MGGVLRVRMKWGRRGQGVPGVRGAPRVRGGGTLCRGSARGLGFAESHRAVPRGWARPLVYRQPVSPSASLPSPSLSSPVRHWLQAL